MIPTCGIGRDMSREYHYSSDNFKNLNRYNLKESLWVLTRIINALEFDKKYIQLPIGQPYLYKYNVNKYDIPVEEILYHCDGNTNILDISEKTNYDMYSVMEVLQELEENNIVELYDVNI
jgi:aminopeptidase-like protein